jgi:hypothetical protein
MISYPFCSAHKFSIAFDREVDHTIEAMITTGKIRNKSTAGPIEISPFIQCENSTSIYPNYSAMRAPMVARSANRSMG